MSLPEMSSTNAAHYIDQCLQHKSELVTLTMYQKILQLGMSVILPIKQMKNYFNGAKLKMYTKICSTY